MPCSLGVCAFPPGLEFCSRDGCAERPALTEEVFMGTRRSWLAFLVLLLPAAAGADDHWVDASASYSQAAGFSQLKGGHFVLTKPLGHIDQTIIPQSKTKNWNVTLDYSFHDGMHDKALVRQQSIMVGARYTQKHRPHAKNLFFYQGSIGGAFTKGSSLDGKRGALAGGVGWEILARGTDPVLVGYRNQADVVFTFGSGQKTYLRYSTGVILRIGEH
jgi:hypothetical protein